MRSKIKVSNQNQELDQNDLAQKRTLLAAERTFLSWIRTGLTSIGIGIASARLIIFQQVNHQIMAHFVGYLLVLWGIGIFGFSLFSYRQICIQIKTDPDWRAFRGLIFATISLIVICLILFWTIVE